MQLSVVIKKSRYKMIQKRGICIVLHKLELTVSSRDDPDMNSDHSKE